MPKKKSNKDLLHAVKALATLVALQQFPGKKNSHTDLINCVGAVEDLMQHFRLSEDLPDDDSAEATSSGTAHAAYLRLWSAAELLGLNKDGKPRIPTDQRTHWFLEGLRKAGAAN